jgi:hypothetical protein
MNNFMYKWLKFSLVALVGCGFFAMAVYAFWKRDEIRLAQIEPPLIQAPEEALKRRPEQPGGMDIPNRDKLVFDLLDGGSPAVELVSPLMPDAVQPDEVALPEVLSTTVRAEPATVKVSPVTPPVKLLPEKQVEDLVVAASAKVVEIKAAEPAVEKVVMPKFAEGVKEKSLPVVAAKGSWGVQLAAVGSKSDADTAAKGLKAKYAVLRPLTPRISTAPGGKYRVQFMGAASRTAATAICSKLAGQPCFPIGK